MRGLDAWVNHEKGLCVMGERRSRRDGVWASLGWVPRGRVVRVALALFAACAAGCVVSASALAGWGHATQVGGKHEFPIVGVAVDPESGDLYATDLFTYKPPVNIFAFNAQHGQLSSFGSGSGSYSGVALSPVSGDLYVVDAKSQEIESYEPESGKLLSSFPVPGSANIFGVYAAVQIASDQVGNVYFPNAPSNEVQVFDAAGAAPAGGVAATITGSGEHALSAPTGVAVDAQGDVWVADSGNGRIEEFTAAGVFVKEIPSAGVSAVAVDAKGDVFASLLGGVGARVVEYDATGSQIDEFGLGVIGESFFGTPNTIAFDETRDLVYVADGGHSVVWAFVPLGVSTGSVTGVSESQATLEGSVEPEGEAVSSCVFEYGTSTSYGHVAPCSSTPSGSGSVAVSAQVSGLETGARYHYRLVASGPFGTARGADETFVPTDSRFGVYTSGSNAFSVVVSNSMIPYPEPVLESAGPLPEVANPSDLDTQAGSHPFALTVKFTLKSNPFEGLLQSQYAKDVAVNLPSGFAGSIVSVPQCPMSRLVTELVGCPTSSQVGTVVVNVGTFGQRRYPAPVYNMVPSDRGTAELAFPVLFVAQPVIVSVRTDGDYGIVSMTKDISQFVPFSGLTITLWGVPGDPRHDSERYTPSSGSAYFGVRHPGDVNVVREQGSSSLKFVNGKGEQMPSGFERGEPLPASGSLGAYLTNPTKCGPSGVDASIVTDSWSDPGPFNPVNHRPESSDPRWVQASTGMYPGGITGCNKMRFNPSITVTPDTAKANSPSGYAINVHVPQDTEPGDLASPTLKNAVATLPQGLAINPGAADGLRACTDNGSEPAGSPGNELGFGSEAEPACPAASQIGSVELRTPLLPEILYGQVYLSADHSGSTYGVFIVIRGEGLLVKLRATTVANPATGQLTATFDNNPELPFSDFTLHFYGGPRAVFVNPAGCGPATTTTDLTSWASEPGGLPDQTPSSTFDVSFDGNGAPCPSPQPFAPSFTAGTTSIQAGGFSPLVSTFSRRDEDQLVNHVQLTAPVGLLGTLRGVPLCREPQAAEGTCPSSSQIGHTVVGVGSGAAPLYLPQPGEPENPVYVTGPYKGAPFGLTFVVHAIAGPYNLGNVVVRAAINVDPSTSALTVTSDPLPTIIDGIPVQVKSVNVVIDREHFIFNPTDCEPSRVLGSMTSRQGSTVNLSSPLQVTGCGDLKFEPEFKVSTSGHPSRADGTSLDARVSFAADALGKQANIAKVKVELPKQLPSRLATLQKACPAQTFESNPAACNPASAIGVAKAVTPTLPGVLSGPVYFVSHGGQAFPNLIVVLQGEGVRANLVASTFISKAGVTSSTFSNIPDVPVNSFELYLPAGPYSALTALAKPCKAKLVMPTTFTAQNGIVLHQNTPIAVTGCGAKAAKASKASRARAARRHHRRRARHGGQDGGAAGQGSRRDARNGRAGR
jgi:NHL repeat